MCVFIDTVYEYVYMHLFQHIIKYSLTLWGTCVVISMDERRQALQERDDHRKIERGNGDCTRRHGFGTNLQVLVSWLDNQSKQDIHGQRYAVRPGQVLEILLDAKVFVLRFIFLAGSRIDNQYKLDNKGCPLRSATCFLGDTLDVRARRSFS